MEPSLTFTQYARMQDYSGLGCGIACVALSTIQKDKDPSFISLFNAALPSELDPYILRKLSLKDRMLLIPTSKQFALNIIKFCCLEEVIVEDFNNSEKRIDDLLYDIIESVNIMRISLEAYLALNLRSGAEKEKSREAAYKILSSYKSYYCFLLKFETDETKINLI